MHFPSIVCGILLQHCDKYPFFYLKCSPTPLNISEDLKECSMHIPWCSTWYSNHIHTVVRLYIIHNLEIDGGFLDFVNFFQVLAHFKPFLGKINFGHIFGPGAIRSKILHQTLSLAYNYLQWKSDVIIFIHSIFTDRRNLGQFLVWRAKIWANLGPNFEKLFFFMFFLFD